jgi:putative metallohydrolase (TIGR04338 family)
MAGDLQRSKVYEAEGLVRRIFDRSVDYPVVQVAGSHLTLPPERKFAAIDSIQSYLDAVLRLRWVGARWPRAATPVVVRARAGQTRAHYERSAAVIAVPLYEDGKAWALRELVVLHELAHHLAPDSDEVPHGPEFAGRMVELVSGVLGEEAGFLLRVTLLDVGAAMS